MTPENALDTKKWRLNNLYRIVDKDGNSIPFNLNSVQAQVLEIQHRRKIILKARQLGMSTFSVIDLLDDALFTPNLSCGIVSYSLEHAQHIFKKIIGHAIDTFFDPLKSYIGVVARSAREITFVNGSSIRVDTTLRGGTHQNILVSEFGKTCARSPQKAEEVVTGTLQAVGQNGSITIESTGEGSDGYFVDMVLSSALHKNINLTPLDYYLCFYAWYEEPQYRLQGKVEYDVRLTDYFNKLESELDIRIDQTQRNWYAVQERVLGDKLKQEYPSTINEAFLSKSDAYYFAEGIQRAYDDNRCVYTNITDSLAPLYVAMDIGVNDLTVMVFFQLCHGEIRIVDYYEDKNKGVDFYAKFLLQDKRYLYHTIFLPHDAARRDNIIVENSYERDFRRLFAGTNTKFHVLPRQDKQLSISYAKVKLDRCVFNVNKVKPLLDQMSKYRKKWVESIGAYSDEPWHNISSNYADAFQYGMQAVGHLEAAGNRGNFLEKHKQVVESRTTRVI
tara:strand:+ start:743 stop:2251 length:1509 start_codon:yes stop_codon:yes gene_type:complete